MSSLSRRLAALLVALLASSAAVAVPALSSPIAGAPTVGGRLVPAKAPVTNPTAAIGTWGDFVRPSDSVLRVTQPNGTVLRARLSDAEIGGHLELDGYTIVKGADGWWRYASGVDKTGTAVASPARAGVDARPAGLQTGAGRRTSVWDDGKGGDARSQMFRQLQLASAQAQAQAAAAGGPRVFRFPVLMLATWFDKANGQTSPQFQPGTDTAAYVKNILDGFGGNSTGSLTEFYFESSFGQFLVQVDVFGPFVSNRSRQDPCYYGGIDQPDSYTDDLDPTDSVLGVGGVGAVGMATEAVPQADAAVNFKNYDNDGDGYVDFMGIVHSGGDMAVTGDPCNTWSHALPVSAFGDIAASVAGLPEGTLRAGLPTSDGVLIDRVFTMPEFDQRGGRLQIGVASHEMAHALGEPDYYAVPYNSSGTGDYDIMAGGSYLGNPDGSNPMIFNPASRVFQGWLQPTIVHGDVTGLELGARNVAPFAGYTVNQSDPNLVLVPTKWINVGQTDELGHTWTQNDVYGLPFDAGHGFVLEGFYVEYIDRVATGPKLDPRQTRAPYFDRGAYSSGLITWHFDYWARSNVYFGANDAQNVPDRLQMDVMEFDRNDTTQELQLNLHRGEESDLITSAATGLTSGTYTVPPGYPPLTGTPQHGIAWSGTVVPTTSDSFDFTVDANPANQTMTVTAGGNGDCMLQLYYEGTPYGKNIDSGGAGDRETAVVDKPAPGNWTAEVGDFTGCIDYTGTVAFAGPGFTTKGAAATYSNWTAKPTGWAFTNIGVGPADGLDNAVERSRAVRLDVVNLSGKVDVSPGFAQAAPNAAGGTGSIVKGAANNMVVPVFSNGGVAPGPTTVTVRQDGPKGPVIATGPISLGAYERKDFAFSWTAPLEGARVLYVRTDLAPGTEALTGNNQQATTLFVGPSAPEVLVVDDEGLLPNERVYAGALSALGVPYAVAGRHVDAATMAQYAAVIWESAIDRMDGQLDANDRAAIAAYLDGGGKLLFTSPRGAGAVEAAGDSAFLQKYFGATTLHTDTYGGGVDAIGTGDLLGTASVNLQPYPVRPFLDTLALATSSAGTPVGLNAISGTGKAGRDGELLGVRLDADAAHHSFQSALLSYNLSQLTDLDQAVSTLGALLKHFGVATPGNTSPATGGLRFMNSPVRQRVSGQAIAVRSFVFGNGATVPVLLYRSELTGGWVSRPMTAGAAPGVWSATIPGNLVTPAGVDYFLTVGSKADIALSGSGLFHTVGSALPELG